MIVKLHNFITGIEVPIDTLSMVDCQELPLQTDLTILKRVYGIARFGTTQKTIIPVKERREDIRRMILKNKEVIGTIPYCLMHERKTFEQIRAERRKREAEAVNK